MSAPLTFRERSVPPECRAEREPLTAPEVAAVARDLLATDLLATDLPATDLPATGPGGLRLPAGWLLALLVPPGPDARGVLLPVRDTAAAFSGALGGVLLDEAAVDGVPTHRCWLYLDEARQRRSLPPNPVLCALAAALGWPRRAIAHWRGPALVTGRDLRWADRDVPSVVVAAALCPGPAR